MGRDVVESRLGSVDRRRGDDGLEREGAVEWLGSMGSRQGKRTQAGWVSAESIRVRRPNLGGVGQASPAPSGPAGSGRPTGRHRRVGSAKVACGDAVNSRRPGLARSGRAAQMNRASRVRQGRRGQPEAAQSTLSGTRRNARAA